MSTTNPLTIPLLYDALVTLGFNAAAEALLDDSEKTKEEVTGEPLNISLLQLIDNHNKVAGKKRNLASLKNNEDEGEDNEDGENSGDESPPSKKKN